MCVRERERVTKGYHVHIVYDVTYLLMSTLGLITEDKKIMPFETNNARISVHIWLSRLSTFTHVKRCIKQGISHVLCFILSCKMYSYRNGIYTYHAGTKNKMIRLSLLHSFSDNGLYQICNGFDIYHTNKKNMSN